MGKQLRRNRKDPLIEVSESTLSRVANGSKTLKHKKRNPQPWITTKHQKNHLGWAKGYMSWKFEYERVIIS